LVSLKEYHALFKQVSHNPYLLEQGIDASYESLETEQLTEKALKIIEPIYIEKINNLADSFKTAKANSLGSDDLLQVIKSALENRVRTVLIQENKIISGKIDYNTGKVDLGYIINPDCDDILDDLAELVLKNRGDVMILPEEKMPSDTGVAGIYRY
jgi:hypothetical protein